MVLVPPINAGPHATPRAHRRMVLLIVVVISVYTKVVQRAFWQNKAKMLNHFNAYRKGTRPESGLMGIRNRSHGRSGDLCSPNR